MARNRFSHLQSEWEYDPNTGRKKHKRVQYVANGTQDIVDLLKTKSFYVENDISNTIEELTGVPHTRVARWLDQFSRPTQEEYDRVMSVLKELD